MRNTAFIILAANEMDGMVSSLPKVMHKLCGATLLEHTFDIISPVTENKPIVVIDSSQQAVALFASERAFVIEHNAGTGTGHAIQSSAQHIPTACEYIIIIPPDMPLIKTETLRKLIDHTAERRLSACVLTPNTDEPYRLTDNNSGRFFTSDDSKSISEETGSSFASSVICFDKQQLFSVLWGLSESNGQLKIEDCIDAVGRLGHVDIMQLSCVESMRIHNRIDLAEAGKILRKEILKKHMLEGVTFVDPDNTYIDKTVRIGCDTVIYPNNYIEGDTVIGQGCCLYPGNRLTDCEIHDSVSMQGVIATSAVIHSGVRLGPYTHLRPGTVLHARSFAGAFVEMKNAEFGEGSKAAHLAYIGDAKVGNSVNIGCGVVFVNYDGKHKHTSIVGDHAFVGSNSNLISPVTIGENGFVAAGSTVTENVPADALCIARSRQENKEGWVVRRNGHDADKKS